MSATQINKNSPRPDKPLWEGSDEKLDFLDRRPLAKHIVNLINNLGDDYEDSIVVGIEGEWGSGKTTFINFILEGVRSIEDNLVVEFNPWNFSDQNELLKDFFNSLIDALEQEDGTKGKLGKFKDYVSKLLKRGQITFSPEISAGPIGLNLPDLYKLDGNPLAKQKKEIGDLIKDIGKRIVIVIDDIDRLDSNETKLIFKLVKLTANFPYTVFILAYDRGRVGKRMNEQGIDGEEYLKKIIQQPFIIPQPNMEDFHMILNFRIRDELEHKGVPSSSKGRLRFGDNRLRSQLLDIMECFERGNLFLTVRDMKRYLNSLHLSLQFLSQSEVNQGDFVGIEALRVFAPKAYSKIAENRSIFTMADLPDNAQPWMKGAEKWMEQRKKSIQRIIEEAPEDLRESIRDIVYVLFPQVEALFEGKITYETEERRTWRKELRVCSEEVSDKYFSLSLPQFELSQSKINNLLSAADNITALYEELKKLHKENEDDILSTPSALFEYLDELSDKQRENLLVCLLDFVEENLGDSLYEGLANEYFTTKLKKSAIGYNILREVPKEKRMEFVKSIIDKTKGFLVITTVLRTMEEEMEYQDGSILTEREYIRLREFYVKKIRLAAKNGSLLKGRKWGETLSYWQEWDPGEETSDYVAQLLKTDEGLLSLLGEFTAANLIKVKDKYKRIRKVDRDRLGDLLDLEDLDKRVNELDASKLSKKDAKIIELYKNPPKEL